MRILPWALGVVGLVVAFVFVPAERVKSYREIVYAGTEVKVPCRDKDLKNTGEWCMTEAKKEYFDKSGLRLAVEGRLKWLGLY